jgi:2-keto-4-pentenoate hydratase/2-oxohepta-3-ene-1,7-dioic acid hydratase in catechol pathway
MIFSYEDLIVYTSKFITLRKGDLIYTGTPVGVGSVAIGDLLKVSSANRRCLAVKLNKLGHLMTKKE